MKKTMFKVLSVCMCLALGFPAYACQNAETPTHTTEKTVRVLADSESFAGADVWATYATEKVLRDKSVDDYASVMQDPVLNILSCQGEYESAQMIFSAKRDISKWNASASALTLVGDESVKIPSELIRVEAEKYTLVPVNAQNNGYPTGHYPDCLVPMENYVASKENTVKAGENQGIYLTVNVPYDQRAGEYKGVLTLTIDDEKKDFPVNLTVCDLKVNEETHMRSKFNSCFTQYVGELDSTQEMFSKYIDVMLEHRIMPSWLIHQYNLHGTEESISLYCKEAAERVKTGKLTNFCIPSFAKTNEQGKYIPDGESLKSYIVMLAKYSIEYDTDIISRAIYTSGIIDEPVLNHYQERLYTFCPAFKQAIAEAEELVNGLKSQYVGKDGFIDKLVESTGNIRLVVTTQYDPSLEEYIDTWCPLFNYYDTEELRAEYDTQEERWWYGCNVPTSPYPTYEIDEGLVNPRVASWMMSEYDITGMLYWAVDAYISTENGVSSYLEDYYDTANRYGKFTGEGYLFYPGAKYGVFGPLSTLRLEAIRDGIEEYELLYNLKEVYKQMGVNEDEVIRSVCSKLYSGTKISADSEEFYSARKTLIQLCRLANCEASVLITEVKDDASGMTYKVFAKNGYEIKQNGAPVTNYETVSDGRIYTVSASRTGSSNTIGFEVQTESGVYEYGVSIGGKVSVYGGQDLFEKIENGKAVVNASLVSASTLDPSLSGNAVKIDVSAVEKSVQSFKYTNAKFNAIGAGTDKIVMKIYNPLSTDISFTMNAKYSKYQVKRALVTTTLKPGMNEIVLSGISTWNWDKFGVLEYLDVYTSAVEVGNYGATTVYFVELSVYDK